MLNFVTNFHFLMTLFVGNLNSYNFHLQDILNFVSGSMNKTLSVWEYYIAYQSQHLTCALHSEIYSRLPNTSFYQESEDIFKFQIYFYIYDSGPAWVDTIRYHCAIIVRNYP